MVITTPARSQLALTCNGGQDANGKIIKKTQNFSGMFKCGLSDTYKDQAYALASAIADVLKYPLMAIYVQDRWEIENA